MAFTFGDIELNNATIHMYLAMIKRGNSQFMVRFANGFKQGVGFLQLGLLKEATKVQSLYCHSKKGT